jgi:hypothetical protein
MDVYSPFKSLESTLGQVVPTVSGRYLAHTKQDTRAREKLAADILDGKVRIDTSTLTAKQVCSLCRVKTYVVEARFPERKKQRMQKRLAKAFGKFEFDSRIEFCRQAGPADVWDALAASIE